MRKINLSNYHVLHCSLFFIVHAHRDPGKSRQSRVQASCLHKAASLPEKSEKVRFYLSGNNLRSCIALLETEDARTETGLYSWRGN